MIRAKLLHQYFWRNTYGKSPTQDKQASASDSNVLEALKEDSDNEEFDALQVQSQSVKEGRFPIYETIDVMPLDFYLQVIGHTSEIERLEEYIDAKTSLIDLPKEMRTKLLYRRYWHRRCQKLVETLIDLKLVHYSFAKEPGQNSTDSSPEGIIFKGTADLILMKSARILDTTQNPHKYRVYHFTSMVNVAKYWSDLEYIALHAVVGDDDIEEAVNEEDLIPKSNSPGDTQTPRQHPEIPKDATLRVNWTGTYQLSSHQKSILHDSEEEAYNLDPTLTIVSPYIIKLSERTRIPPLEVLNYLRRRKKKEINRIHRL